MSDKSQEEPRAEDLDVPAAESDDVKGGLLLPAVQAAREAARRSQAQGGKFEGQIEIDSWSV